MISIVPTKRFNKEYKKFVKNNLQRAESIVKAIDLFVKDPKHPSLHIEKLEGTGIWSMRIDRGNRIFFLWTDENTVLFIDIGHHDKYRNY